MGTGQYPGARPKPTAGAPLFSGHRAPSVSPAAARCHVPVDRRQRMGESAGDRNAGTFGKFFQPVHAPEAEKMTALSSIDYPHWLILLLMPGFGGFALR